MPVQKFYEECKAISNSPYSRLSNLTKSIIDRDAFVVDTHCHLFPKSRLPLKYILKRLPDFLKLLKTEKKGSYKQFDRKLRRFNRFLNRKYRNEEIDIYLESFENDLELELPKLDDELTPEEIAEFEKILNSMLNQIELSELDQEYIILNEQDRKILKIIKAVLAAIKIISLEDIYDVYDYYADKFLLGESELLKTKNLDTLVVAPQMDIETAWKDDQEIEVEIKFKHAIEWYLGVSRVKPVLPFFAVHPDRTDLYELFIKAFVPDGNNFNEPKNTFFGVKVYPALGYDPSDFRLMPIYKICAEKNIPVMTHCGGTTINSRKNTATIFRFDPKNSNVDKGEFGYIKEKLTETSEVELAQKLNDPWRWENVINTFKDLKLNLAHFGGSESWEIENFMEQERIKKVTELMKIPNTNVYADFSFNLIQGDKVNKNFLKALMEDETIKDRAMFGTDFWVVTPKGDLKKAQDKFIETTLKYIMKLAKENPKKFLGLDKDLYVKLNAIA